MKPSLKRYKMMTIFQKRIKATIATKGLPVMMNLVEYCKMSRIELQLVLSVWKLCPARL
jgi:serine kinase of HPr protein (carbohydrate metabolism regulator)